MITTNTLALIILRVAKHLVKLLEEAMGKPSSFKEKDKGD